MSRLAAPAAARLQRSLENVLTPGEQLRIAATLGGGLLAGGLFLVGASIERWGLPERRLIGISCQALAALLVVLPSAWGALAGLWTRRPERQVEQLVTVAALAAAAVGDFSTATLIPLIMHLGHFLEERSVMGAQAAVAGLRQLEQRAARVLRNGAEIDVPVAELRLGDLAIVRPGDLLPGDGRIREGSSAIDQSSITGESLPREVAPGDDVFAGTSNLSGRLVVEIVRLGGDTALGRVAALLRDAEQSKTPVLRLIEQYAGLFLLLVLSMAGVVLFLTRDVYRAIAVLVVGCPGAFLLAGPSAMVAALASAARWGVLIKNTKFLESLADVDTVVLDKTGTVTFGELRVVGCHRPEGPPAPNAAAASVGSRPPAIDDRHLLSQAARCARSSRHPVSRAICRAVEQHRRPPDDASGLALESSGLGVRYESNGTVQYVGRRSWLEAEGFDVPPDPDHPGALVWVAERRRGEGAPPGMEVRSVLGAILLADEPRPEAHQAIQALRRLGVARCLLLTGDRRCVAEQIGAALQIDQVAAELLPEQKLDFVQREKAAGGRVAVVGDGINDALALAAGDVGIAMGALGSDVAIQSADIVLATSDLTRLPLAISLARRTRATIHQNVLVGGAITLGLLAVAAAGWISPLAGAILHNLGEVYVLLNSARLARRQAFRRPHP